MQNNFTTPEQSKRLLELGVPEWTADCRTYRNRDGSLNIYVHKGGRCHQRGKFLTSQPCWSVGRLMEVFDNCFTDENSQTAMWECYNSVNANDDFDEGYVGYIIDCYETNIGKLDFTKLED